LSERANNNNKSNDNIDSHNNSGDNNDGANNNDDRIDDDGDGGNDNDFWLFVASNNNNSDDFIDGSLDDVIVDRDNNTDKQPLQFRHRLFRFAHRVPTTLARRTAHSGVDAVVETASMPWQAAL
jgi:hypothetical protein